MQLNILALDGAFDTGLAKTVRWYLDNHAWVERCASGAYRDWMRINYEDRDRP